MKTEFGTFVDTGDWCGRLIAVTHTCVVYFDGVEEVVSQHRYGEHGQYWDTTPERQSKLWTEENEKDWLYFIARTYSSNRHKLDKSLSQKYSFGSSTYEQRADRILGQ